jgi:hypothetical protein
MKYLLLVIACMFVVDAIAPAFAQSGKHCTTTCSSYGTTRTCTKSCY